MSLTDILTLPLKVAQETLAQPTQPQADPATYIDETDKAQFNANLPNFFRQAAANIAQAEQVRQAQEQEFQARQQAQAPEYDTADEEAAYTNQQYAQAMQARQQIQQQAQDTEQVQVQEEAPVRTGGGRSFLDKIGNVLGQAADIPVDIARKVDVGLAKAGDIAASTRLPGTEYVRRALHVPDAADKGFLEGFKKQHGEDFNLWTGVKGIEHGLEDEQMWLNKRMNYLTGHTIDPLINNTVGELSPGTARWMTAAVDRIGELAPYAILMALTGGGAAVTQGSNIARMIAFTKTPLGATFAAQSAAQLGEATEAYKNGQITGGQFASATAMNIGANFGPDVAAPLLANVLRNIKAPGVRAQLMRDIQEASGKAEGLGQADRGEVAGSVLAERGVREQKAFEDQYRTVEEADAALKNVGVGENVPEITESPRTPDDIRTDRRVRTTPDGGFIDYSGTHINNVNNAEVRGHGSALLDNAIADIRSRHPREPITAELNTPEGATLFAKQKGAMFTDRTGKAITPDEAQALAREFKGPLVELPATAERVSPPRTKTPPARAPAGPEGTRVNPGEGWEHDTFDQIPRKPTIHTPYGRVYERPDGTFDVFDSRWSDVTHGKTAGGPEGAIRNFATREEARAALEDLTAKSGRGANARINAFRAGAKEALAEAEQKKVSVVEEATKVSEEAQAERPTTRTPRVQREALEISRSEQTFRPQVKDTLGEQGGATYDPRTGAAVPNKDYFVGGFAPTKTVKASEFGPDDLAGYVRDNFDDAFSKEGVHVGTERVTRDGVGYVNIDAVRIIETEAEALRLGKSSGQERIWDANKGKVVEVPGIKQTEQTAFTDGSFTHGNKDIGERGAVSGTQALSVETAVPSDIPLRTAEIEDLLVNQGWKPLVASNWQSIPGAPGFEWSTLLAGNKPLTAPNPWYEAQLLVRNLEQFPAVKEGVVISAGLKDAGYGKGSVRFTSLFRNGEENIEQIFKRYKASPVSRLSFLAELRAKNPIARAAERGKQIIEAEVTKVERFLSGETGALDLARVGVVARDWVSKAGAGVKRVIEYVKSLGRTFHNNELGAIMAGRKAPEGVSRADILDFGASRRWLHPEENKAVWAKEMSVRVGGSQEYWKSQLGAVRAHVEGYYGLLGKGKQGILSSGKRFGQEAGPTPLARLIDLYESGRELKQRGQTIDMSKWYDNFWKTMNEHFGDDAEMMTRILADTQMNNAPSAGVPIAMRAYLQWKMGEPISRMGNSAIREQVESFLMGNLPKGPKINPFWEALRYESARGRNAVAIDRWVIGALGAKAKARGMDVKNLQGNKAFIRFSQQLIRDAADEAGVDPRAFQASIWGGFRKEWDAMLKAAGGKPLGGDNDFFENLLLKKLGQYDLRSPADFRLNSVKSAQAQLFDHDPAQAEVEFWQQSRAAELAKHLNTTPAKADEILNDTMMSEWNTKIAAARLLDTGEVPAHLRTPEVIDNVTRQAEFYRQAFRDRVRYADDETLKKLTDVPEWQKREITDELDHRTRGSEQATESLKALPVKERERLSMLGWMRIPDNPVKVARTDVSLAELDAITTEAELIRWMNRTGNKEIVGDPKAFIGTRMKTGEMYDLNGKMTEKTAPSPYWEPKSFYENRLVLNVGRVKAEIRKRFPLDTSGQSRNLADTLKLKSVKEPLGECGMSVAGAAL